MISLPFTMRDETDHYVTSTATEKIHFREKNVINFHGITNLLQRINVDGLKPWTTTNYPVNTEYLCNIYTMLDQRRRRWAGVV